MRSTICFFFILSTLITSAQEASIIPQPVNLKRIDENKTFSVSSSTVIVLEGSNLEKSAAYLNAYLKKHYRFSLKVVKTSRSLNSIRLNYERMDKPLPGAYMLRIDDRGVYLAGDNETGVFTGIQTLIQLLSMPDTKLTKPSVSLPFLYVDDEPRFAYRGMHLDVCRHFFPVSFIKQYIDYLALHKFNKFHWHLTDDQGWRIEIKKYPKLTQVGAWRNGTIIGRYPGTGNDNEKYGGFYTQAEIKEVVKYAADRYIDVIPEIEMPGHSSAAIASYPQLSCFPETPTYEYFPKECAWNGEKTGKQVQQTWGVFDDVFCVGNDSTFLFLQNVLDEVLTLFPSKYIHVGGDECPKENWKRCVKCQQRMTAEHLTDEHQLQSYFIQRIEKYLNNKGRTLIGWDEILEGGLAPNAIVMSWRGEDGGVLAAQQKHEVIMTPGNPVYFDHTQSENEDSVTIGGFNPLEKVYAYEPIPAKLTEYESRFVMGAQANMWTEYMTNPGKVEYMLFPRMAALSEVLWSKKENRNWEAFQKKLPAQFQRYDLWKANYSKAFFELKSFVEPSEQTGKLKWTLSNKFDMSQTTLYEIIKKNTHDTVAIYDPKDLKITGYKVVNDTIVRKPAIPVFTNSASFNIDHSGIYEIENYKLYSPFGETIRDRSFPITTIKQTFSFNKATGKKITLTNPASDKYPGDGPFTLVNGVQNEKGFARSKEFLGFNGTDCEAVIDLGKEESVSFVKVHVLDRKSSWIWPPSQMKVYYSADGINFIEAPNADGQKSVPGELINSIDMGFSPAFKTRYIKVFLKNFGPIPAGNPGAGNKAWLFVDEIEVK